MMRIFRCMFLFVLVLGSALAIAQSSGGFVPLFDGKTLDGWVRVTTAESRPFGEGKDFFVSEGVIRAHGGPSLETETNVYLHTVRQYTDFTLKWEVRYATPEADGGVLVRSPAGGSKTFQIQLRDGTINRPVAWSGNLIRIEPCVHGETTFDFSAALRAYKKQGEWDAYEVEVIGQRLTVKVNGVLVTRAYSMLPTGYILLLAEKGDMDYRNIQIREER